MKYFHSCESLAEVKKLYKKLALENHPDRGGDTATMQAINTEYAFAIATLLKGEKLTDEQINEEIHLSEEYREVVDKIMNLPGIIIEIVGYYIWVTGLTKPVREQLKAAKFVWHKKKECWYYAPAKFKKRTYGVELSLEEIKSRYGCEQVNKYRNGKVLK